MKRTSLDISGKIDPLTIAVYDVIASVAEQNNVKFFVVGATARDIVLHHGYGIPVRRATRDIDLAVQVSEWNEFEGLKKSLVATGQFTTTAANQRLRFRDNLQIDIVPFGAIQAADGSLRWPPEHELRMNALGFQEAYDDALTVKIKDNPELNIHVASPPALAALKLIAWNERGQGNPKDAIDLIFIMRAYLDAGNNQRLHEQHPDLIDEEFDYLKAGARLLGRDIAAILSKESLTLLNQILQTQTAEGDSYPLVEDMTRGGTAEDFELNLELLKVLQQGVNE